MPFIKSKRILLYCVQSGFEICTDSLLLLISSNSAANDRFLWTSIQFWVEIARGYTVDFLELLADLCKEIRFEIVRQNAIEIPNFAL